MLEPVSFSSIVLCGGHSSRMGQDKANLAFGDRTLLETVVGVFRSIPSCRRIVVVAAEGQELPESVRTYSDEHVLLTTDRTPGRGPLEGFVSGLLKLEESDPTGHHQTCFLTSCDVPLLQIRFVEAVVASLIDGFDAAVPHDETSAQPLAAAYRRSVLLPATELLAGGRQSMKALLEVIRARTIPADMLRSADPRLQSLHNLNTPEEYAATLRWMMTSSGTFSQD